MSTRRNPVGRKESLRSQSLSTSSPRRTDLKISNPLPYPLPADGPPNADDNSNRQLRTSHGTSSGSQTRQSHTSSPHSVRASSRPATYRHDKPFGNSAHGPQDSVSSDVSHASNAQMHRRRASTLRTVMRKLFGRKRQSLGDDLAEDDREHDPGSFSSQMSPGMPPGSPYGPAPGSPRTRPRTRSHRSQSVPNQEAAFPTVPESPLPRSPADPSKLSPMHSPTTDSNSLLPSPEHRIPSRRATLPSIALSTEDARELADKAAQQSARESQAESSPDERRGRDSLETVAKQPKRRSRSANELRKIANAHLMSPIQWRRYSDHNKEQTVVEDPPRQAFPEPASRAESREDELTSLGPDPQNDNASDSVYEYGNLIETIQNNSGMGVDQRVAMLEVKLMDLELAIAKLQGQEASPFQRSGSKDRSKSQTPEAKAELHPPPTFQDPNHLFPARSDPRATPPRSSPAGDARPESSSTVRPQTSQDPYSSHLSIMQPPSSEFRGISVEQYSALTTLVRREQSARKLLEDQVLQMRDDIQYLRDRERSRGRSRDRDPLQPPADSFYCPSSPDSLEGRSSGTPPRGSQRGSERGSHRAAPVSATRNTNYSYNHYKKGDPGRNRSDSYLPHSSNSPRYAGSFERTQLRKHSSPETGPEVRPQAAGMI